MSKQNEALTHTLALDVHNRFPETPTLTLAKKLYKENPQVYNNVDHARSSLKYIRGQNGVESREKREKATGVKFDIPGSPNYAPFKIPKSDADSWEPFELKAKKLLILSDIHLPYHDEKALEIAINYGLKEGCESLLINGDLLDFYQLSRFDKDPRKRHFSDEIEMGREFLKECARHFKTFYKLGNHEERYENYLKVKAPEFLNVPDFELKILLRAGENKMEFIENKRIIQAGHLNIIHGHEFMGGGGGGVNPARALFLKSNESCIEGHFHRSAEHTETSMTGKITTTWSTGCLCDLHPEYARLNKWNHGFCIVEFSGNNYHVSNKRIYEGKVL